MRAGGRERPRMPSLEGQEIQQGKVEKLKEKKP